MTCGTPGLVGSGSGDRRRLPSPDGKVRGRRDGDELDGVVRVRCALCDSPAWHGWEHDRENYAVREWRRPMLRAHTDMILRMRPLGPPDDDCTDENRHGSGRVGSKASGKPSRRPMTAQRWIACQNEG